MGLRLQMLIVRATFFAYVALFLFLMAALVWGESRVSIKVVPHVVMAGQPITIVCSVPRNSENRLLTIGVVDFTSHDDQLDGDEAYVTHRATFSHVPCDASLAYCLLKDSHGAQAVAKEQIVVMGCEP